jgi:site-specific DNA-methyltransferase (adenine-specific)
MINLMHGDCLEMMKTIPDGSVDMVLTDPPYGTTACKWDSVIPFEPMWEQLKRITKKNGAIVLTASQPFTSALVMSNVKMFKYCWVWGKSKATGHLHAKHMPMKSHEDVCVFYDKQCTYNPLKTDGTPYRGRKNIGDRGNFSKEFEGSDENVRYDNKTGLRNPTTIQFFKNAQYESKTTHPTQKPVALMEYLIRTYTNEGETVLDFTMGSGTTGVAAGNLDRSFIGIELDETYFKIASDRINKIDDNPLNPDLFE